MKILVTTSTLPVSRTDEVPAFVKDQAMELKKKYPDLDIVIHAPHNTYSQTDKKIRRNEYYSEVRFHYFWPFRWELLTGRGILPALRQNKLLYFQIPFLFFFQFVSLLFIVRKEKPDLIYAHWFTPQAINAAFVSKITKSPFVFTTHASDVSVLKRLPLSNKLVVWVCKRASAYTAVSGRTAKKLTSFFEAKDWKKNYAGKLSIIPMGVSTVNPETSLRDINRVKEVFGLPDGKQYVLFLGRLSEKKGVRYLLDAFSKLPGSLTRDLHLIIAGDGQLKKTLEQQAKRLDIKNITFTGYVHGVEKNALFTLSDFTCFPSIIDDSGDSEGFPLVLMESLAAGKIVLASDATGGETILIDGKSGFVFREKSIDALTRAITRAIKLDPKAMTDMQKESAKLADQFDWDKIVEKHYNLFKEAVYENTTN